MKMIIERRNNVKTKQEVIEEIERTEELRAKLKILVDQAINDLDINGEADFYKLHSAVSRWDETAIRSGTLQWVLDYDPKTSPNQN